MTIYSEFGIYSGGDVVKDSGMIKIRPCKLTLKSGEITALGAAPAVLTPIIPTLGTNTANIQSYTSSKLDKLNDLTANFTLAKVGDVVELTGAGVGFISCKIKLILDANNIVVDTYLPNVATASYVVKKSSGFAKQILLTFGAISTQVIPIRSTTQLPEYYLNINSSAAGQCWIYWDDSIQDIALSIGISRPSLDKIQFAKLSWNSGATSINDITISYTNDARNEAYVSSSANPETADKMYYDSQPFNSGNRNIPFANISNLVEVLENESLLQFGLEYYITFAQPFDVYGDGTKVYLKSCKHMGKARNTYSIFDTKTDVSLSPNGTALIKDFTLISNVQNTVIYVMINKRTGVPLIDTVTQPDTHFLIAYGVVSNTETDLANVNFTIVNNLGGQSLWVETFASFIRSERTSGFLNRFDVEEITNNKLRFLPNIINIDGYLAPFLVQDVDLGAAPLTGYRQDFVYVEIYKSAIPWTMINYTVKVVQDVDSKNYPDPFTNVAKVKNNQNNPYTYDRKGFYKAIDTNAVVDGYSVAIPLAIVHRFNQGIYANANQNGASIGSRPDGKNHNVIGLSEVEIKAPVTKIPPNALTTAIRKILTGSLNNKLQPAVLDTNVLSRQPLQVDRIGINSVLSGSTYIGQTDGQRYQFDNKKQGTSVMYGLFKENQDTGLAPYNFTCVIFNDASKKITLQVPTNTEAEILKDPLTNQPIDVSVKWKDTGLPVGFTGLWSVGQPRIMENILDQLDPNYVLGGEIVVLFKIRYTESYRVGLTKPPVKIISAANSNDYNTLASSFAVATEENGVPKFIKNMSRVTTVNSQTYTDELYLQRLGSVNKFYTYELHYYVSGNNSNVADYSISDLIVDNGNYSLVGVIDAINVITNQSIPITKVQWTNNMGSQFLIRLGQAIPVNTPVKFIFGVAGDASKQMDLEVGSLSVLNLTETKTFQVTAAVAGVNPNPAGVYRISDGNIVYGASSRKTNIGTRTVAYVGDEEVFVTINGFGTNLLSVDFRQSNISTLNPLNWLGSGPYYPKPGTLLRIPVLCSYRTGPSEIYIQYLYNSLPFIPFKPTSLNPAYNDFLSESRLPYLGNDGAFTIERGLLALSNDGTANDSIGEESPFSERFPVVQGVTDVGIDSPVVPIGLNDVLIYQQPLGNFLEGLKIDFQKTTALSVSVEQGKGFVCYLALIKQLNCIRLFLYEVRNGQFVMDNPDQAFVAELDQNYRGV